MKKESFTLIFIIFFTISAFTQDEDLVLWKSGKTFVFNTTEHSKSKGLNLSIKFPENWIAHEGAHPNVLKNFYRNDKADVECIIIIKKLPKTPTAKDIIGMKSISQIKAIVPKSGKYLNSNSLLKIDGEPAFFVEFYNERKVGNNLAGVDMKMYSSLYSIIYKDYLIQIGFSVSNSPQDLNDNLEAKYKSYNLIFKQIINSTIILSKWQ